MDGDNGTRWKWIEKFARAIDSVRVSDRGEFLADLVDASLQLSRAERAYGILMEGDIVLTEAGLTVVGDPFDAEDSVRKLAARTKLRAAERARDPDRTVHFPGIHSEEGRVFLPFIVREEIGGSVVLEGLNEDSDREIGLTMGLVLSASRNLGGREVQSLAADRARSAESRRQELERSASSGGVGGVAFLKKMSDLERDAIELALRTTNWNKEQAARLIGISRASIYMKVKKFGLQNPPDRGAAESES